MLTKFETQKSNRVKGLAFHPKRPWVLVSLHNGVIQLWDYRMGALIDKFEEHDGVPVRGVHFHPTSPLFVSGGDDYKVKVWDYKLKRCLFTLVGHLDYVRTVQFHHEQPWIVSASDDQTIRIWNWQSRTCVAVLTGHNHYVMSAFFHPREDLIVSASLDQTVRVWDISGLKKNRPSHSEDVFRLTSINTDLFGSNDAVVKYVLEGHERGVNWAAFHPTLPLIVSGADDRQIKLWRMNESKAWEVDSMRGHTNNVSCVMFHPKQELIISNSEDKTIRIWDMTKRVCLQTIRRDTDRFWILAVHPSQNLIAAGHDSGMFVFKLERERPPHCIYQSGVYYVKDKTVRYYDLDRNEDSQVFGLRRQNSGVLRTISYNHAENLVLLDSDYEGGTYEIYQLSSPTESKKGSGSAVFVARNKIAVLDKNRQIVIKTIKNEVVKKIVPSTGQVDAMFPAGMGSVLLKCEDKILLFDIQLKRVANEISAAGIKYVVWSGDNSRVALLSKHLIVVANKKLDHICTAHEAIRVKSAAFDEHGVLIYTTLNHLKYLLPSGDSGIIQTLDNPWYLVRVHANAIHYLDRDGNVGLTYVDSTEYKFKQALLEKKNHEIARILKQAKLNGQSIIAYLQKKGYPEIAMHFVEDLRTKFNLALECGNIPIAVECAEKLNVDACWKSLAEEALKLGNLKTVEQCYQRLKDFEKLSFLYLITGDIEKLRRLMSIAQYRGDTMGRFQNALLLGDVEERVKSLKDVGLTNLAYVTASTFNIEGEKEFLQEQLESDKSISELETEPDACLLHPPTPILRAEEQNWPLLEVSKGIFSNIFASDGTLLDMGTATTEEVPVGSGWEEMGKEIFGEDERVADTLEKLENAVEIAEEPGEVFDEEGGWESMDIPGFESDLPVPMKMQGASSGIYVVPQLGTPLTQRWTENSQLAADHVAAGTFDSAMQILHRTCGVVNFAPLKQLFMSVYMSSTAHAVSIPGCSPVAYPLSRNSEDVMSRRNSSLPVLCTSLEYLITRLKAGYHAVKEGKFVEAHSIFLSILHALLLTVVSTRDEVTEVKELLGISREYVTAMKLEMKRKELKDKPTRQAELVSYFTHCNLQVDHLVLAIRLAMTLHYKLKNFEYAGVFAKRLLELNPKPEVAQQALRVAQVSEEKPTNEHKINYDPKNPFVICGYSFTPIYRGNASVRCSYCFAPYLPEFNGQQCNVCGIAQIGKDVAGMICSDSQFR